MELDINDFKSRMNHIVNEYNNSMNQLLKELGDKTRSEYPNSNLIDSECTYSFGIKTTAKNYIQSFDNQC